MKNEEQCNTFTDKRNYVLLYQKSQPSHGQRSSRVLILKINSRRCKRKSIAAVEYVEFFYTRSISYEYDMIGVFEEVTPTSNSNIRTRVRS